MRPLRPLVAFAVVAAACSATPGDVGGEPAPPTTAPGETTVTTSTETTAPGEGPGTTTTRVPPDGAPAPDFTLTLGDGGEFTLSEEPKPVHLVFWAEWCPVCSRELPAIDAVAADYLDEVTFVAVAGRSSLEASRPRVGLWFSPDRLLWGYDDGLWQTYLVRGQPVSFLISSDGIIVDHWFGYSGEDELRVRLDRLVSIG